MKPVGRIIAASSVVKEPFAPVGSVGHAGGVAEEGIKTGGRVLEASRIIEQSAKSLSSVGIASSVVKERLIPIGRIIYPAGQTEERVSSLGRVRAGIATVWRRSNPESVRGGRKHKASKGERDEKKTASPSRRASKTSYN